MDDSRKNFPYSGFKPEPSDSLVGRFVTLGHLVRVEIFYMVRVMNVAVIAETLFHL